MSPFSGGHLFIQLGDQYVDWLSLDGYNSDSGQKWYQPGEVFDGIHPSPPLSSLSNFSLKSNYCLVMLYKLRDFRPNLPVMISETGSYSAGGLRVADKAQWLTNLMPYLAKWSIYINEERGDMFILFCFAVVLF